MNSIGKQAPEFQAGDIINVQGTGIISRLIRWATNSDWSHTAMICCRLGNGKYMVIEMVANGILIRPLSVYQSKKVIILRVKGQNVKELGKQAILKAVDMIPKYDYAFEKILYLGLILIPRRIFRRYPLTRKGEYNGTKHKFTPKGIYQVFCYYLTKVISTVTLMPYWGAILRLFSKDRWLEFTEKVIKRTMPTKIINGEVSYTEFVKIIEEELELQKKAREG